MSGWMNKGGARSWWMQCPHISGPDGRCTGCNAIEVAGWKQSQHIGRGGVVGADMEPVMRTTPGLDITHLKGDGASKRRFTR
jgi:hypothetical protein